MTTAFQRYFSEFPTRFPARFSARFSARISHKISHKIFLSWILIGWLRITLFQMLNFHQSLPFLNWLFPLVPYPQDFPARISCKIFPQDFPELDPDWLTPHHPIPNAKFPPITVFLKLAFSLHCCPPARFSRKIFLYAKFPPITEFPTRFSHKILLSWILIGWLRITLFQMLNFHQSLPFLNWLFPLLPVPQDFPARISAAFLKLAFSPPPCPTRFSCKNFLQEFPTRFFRNNFPQEFPVRFCQKIFLSWTLIGWLPITLFQMLNFHQSLPFLNWLFPSFLSCKIFQQDFSVRISYKIFLSWILIGWLPITLFQMLNFHQSLLC